VNTVVLIGRMETIGKLIKHEKWQRCDAVINVARPYKVHGDFKYDRFKLIAWGEYARRITTAKKGQIVGITGILEGDDKGGACVNVKGITFYTNEMEAALERQQKPEEEMEEIAGFAAVAVSEIPDF